MKRTLYIGDVHGCADELERIIDAFGFVRNSDTLYQTGDCINKGPDSVRTIRLIEKLGILTVRGNHEEHLLRMMNSNEDSWTEKQRARFEKHTREEWDYIRSIVKSWPLWRDTPYATLVHAGLEPGQKDISLMNPKVLLSIRKWNDKPWYEQITWPKTVVFGHWAENGLVRTPNFIGLDSGCVYGKFLSAWCPEEDKFYQVQAKKVYAKVNSKKQIENLVPCLHPDETLMSSGFSDTIIKAAPALIKEWGK